VEADFRYRWLGRALGRQFASAIFLRLKYHLLLRGCRRDWFFCWRLSPRCLNCQNLSAPTFSKYLNLADSKPLVDLSYCFSCLHIYAYCLNFNLIPFLSFSNQIIDFLLFILIPNSNSSPNLYLTSNSYYFSHPSHKCLDFYPFFLNFHLPRHLHSFRLLRELTALESFDWWYFLFHNFGFLCLAP